jgi:DNA-binding NarL/FixJ family response regulator
VAERPPPSLDHGLTQVWIDDPNAIFRRGLASSLEGQPFAVVGESEELQPEPNLCSLDILLFALEDGGLQRATQLSAGTETSLVALVGVASEQDLLAAVEAGVHGLLIRSQLTLPVLVSCLSAVAEGHGSVPPALLARLLARLCAGAGGHAAEGELVERELQVLRLLASGGDTREVAVELAYSERTVKNIVHDLLLKLNCRTRAHAVAVASRRGLI